mgnify:CR=1 FL=1
MTRLSKRLRAALEHVKGYSLLVDIGTDHAKLPLAAVGRGYVTRAIAVDNKPKPLESARANIRDAKMEAAIELRLGDGFPKTDAFAVAAILGLGGLTIRDILEKGELANIRRLVISPNSDAGAIRTWLMANDWQIVAEEFLEDAGKYYQIIVSQPGTMRLTEAECEFGPLIIKEQSQVFQTAIHKQIAILEKAAKNVNSPTERDALHDRINLLKGLIA